MIRPRYLLALVLTIFSAMRAIGFLGTSPYIVIDWRRFPTGVTGVQSHLMEGHGAVLGRGWWAVAPA